MRSNSWHPNISYWMWNDAFRTSKEVNFNVESIKAHHPFGGVFILSVTVLRRCECAANTLKTWPHTFSNTSQSSGFVRRTNEGGYYIPGSFKCVLLLSFWDFNLWLCSWLAWRPDCDSAGRRREDGWRPPGWAPSGQRSPGVRKMRVQRWESWNREEGIESSWRYTSYTHI